jgi:two-component system NarL family response regulator
MSCETKLLLVDNQPIWREGLQFTLRRHLPHTQFLLAHSGQDALHCLRQQHVDLVLTELILPDMHAFDLVRNAAEIRTSARCAVMAPTRTAALAAGARQAGACALLHWRIDPIELMNALHRIVMGDRVFELDRPIAPLNLTNRESQILLSLHEGLSNKQISERLAMAEPTIKTHLRSLFDKLEVKNRTACVSAAQRAGLL